MNKFLVKVVKFISVIISLTCCCLGTVIMLANKDISPFFSTFTLLFPSTIGMFRFDIHQDSLDKLLMIYMALVVVWLILRKILSTAKHRLNNTKLS